MVFVDAEGLARCLVVERLDDQKLGEMISAPDGAEGRRRQAALGALRLQS